MLQKLFPGSAKIAISTMEQIYTKHGYAIVNFLYFANAMQYRLFEHPRSQTDILYKMALENCDMLLPDGIALQLWDRWNTKPKRYVHNLNGTDLTPHILSYFSQHYTVHLYIVSLYDENIGKGKEWLDIGAQKCKEIFGIQNVFTHQVHYRERGEKFPFDEWGQHEYKNGTLRILLHCTGTPFQEIWSQQYRQWIQDNHMLVLNVGGFIDFFSGFETRAPKRVVKMRVLETFWRVATNPTKNLKKFLAMFGVRRILWSRLIKKKK